MIRMLRRAAHDSLATVAWPKGPLLVLFAALIALVVYVLGANAELGAEQMKRLVFGALIVAVALGLIVFCANLLVAPYRIERERADAAEAAAASVASAPLGDEQIRQIIAQHYDSAHTFVHFCFSGGASLTQNVRSITVHDTCELSISFIQPMDESTIRVRPVGGTPKFSVVSYDLWHVRVRLTMGVDVVQFRIFGRLIPVIRNHPDGREFNVLAYPRATQG